MNYQATSIKAHIAMLAIASSALAWASPGAHGPNGEHLDQATAPTSSGLARLPDGSVNVPKLAQRRMGLRTQIAPEVEAAVTIQLPGRVVADPNASGQVQAVHGGRVEMGSRGLPVAGQTVRQGEVLAWLRHHADPFTLSAQQSQHIELKAARELAQQKLLRLEALEGTVPRKEIDAARVELRSLTEREQRTALSIESREPLIAPISGVIARADLKIGQIVDARDLLVEILDPTRLMVEASTPDVSLGNRLSAAHLAGFDGVKLQMIGAARALRDGVLPLNFRALVTAGTTPLALGQPVTLLASLKERRKGIVLPASAVVRSPANESVVWIKTGTERYTPQPVQIPPLDAVTVLVTQGLAPDNRVLVQGAGLVAQIR
jgi:cobalt-zinc-cadmium efflux system membrane fusion protein